MQLPRALGLEDVHATLGHQFTQRWYGFGYELVLKMWGQTILARVFLTNYARLMTNICVETA